MPNAIQNLYQTFEDPENGLIFEKNVDVQLRNSNIPIRCNVYRPLDTKPGQKYPVLVTYGPYGKDIWYGDFSPKYVDVPQEHKSKYAAWETPEPTFWTKHGYVVVRADERGLGQSPGIMDTMSRGTSECFFDVVEWAAAQPWSSGKIGLLGISYFAGSQWRVAARRPKGLACIIPWEGMSDYYRDRCRHGGILSNGFIKYWWNRQVITNQYGRPGRAASKWGEDTLEGDLPAEQLLANCQDQNRDNEANKFRDDEYHASKEYRLEDIEVPLLSVANWGGINLHLRGNIHGYLWAGSNQKWLRCIVGRHDLPFYYPEEVEVQKSFLDCFLKGEDRGGWTAGRVPAVSLCLRKGDVGWNNPKGEICFPRRTENEWPIARTQYIKFYLSPDRSLKPALEQQPTKVLSYEALGSCNNPQLLQFEARFEQETEITGHPVAHLNVSVQSSTEPTPKKLDMDLFLTLRHISAKGKEVFYTGSSGDNMPVVKGWLRASLRKIREDHPRHRSYLPFREYLSTDVQPLEDSEVYSVDVEIWPTNVIIEKGGKLIFEISSGDTQGCGVFKHNSEIDRAKEHFQGINSIHFGPEYENYLTLPIIPPAETLQSNAAANI